MPPKIHREGQGQAAGSATIPREPSGQGSSRGNSSGEIHELTLSLAEPRPGQSWLDIGCGTGDVLRAIRDRHSPTSLAGIDVIDWLADDLRDDVTMVVGPAEEGLARLEPVDRVLMIEVLEHLEAPWSVLRAAAGMVAPGGRMVISTPSITNFRHRAELLIRGSLTSFRPDNGPHSTPALPHVIERVLQGAGLGPSIGYGARDVIPLTRGKLWPQRVHARALELTSVSTVVVADAPEG